MPTFYKYTENGQVYSIDDVFVPADAFRQGNLWTWGQNYGQLGTGGGYSPTPVTTFAGGANWKQVACGSYHTAAIKTDGTLWTCGRNGDLQLGTGGGGSGQTPVTTFAGGTNWKQVSGGRSHTVAIKTDGTLWTWGSSGDGQLGTNDATTKSTPVTTFAGGASWKQVACGEYHTMAIKTDGTLWSWGNNGLGALGVNNTINRSTPVTTFAGGTNWKQVAGGDYYTVAVKTDGTLWGWGYSALGQLGTNGTTTTYNPVTTFAGGTNWKQVACGENHTVAIKTDGTLWNWGWNQYGQLGTNDTIDRNTPVTTFAGGANWKQVACGSRHTLAIKTDGTLWSWGRNFAGAGGSGDGPNKSTPVTTFAGGTNWKQVACGDNYTAALTYIDEYI